MLSTDKQKLWFWGRVYPKPAVDVWDDTGKFKNRSIDQHTDRLTEFSKQELRELDLSGIPIKWNHAGTTENKLGPELIGRVVASRVASDGSLFVLAYIDTGRGGNHHDYRTVGNIVRNEIRAGRLRGLSIGYSYTSPDEYMRTKTASRQVLEVSIVKTPARPDCYIEAYVDDIETRGHENQLRELNKVFDFLSEKKKSAPQPAMDVRNILSVLDNVKKVNFIIFLKYIFILKNRPLLYWRAITHTHTNFLISRSFFAKKLIF